MTSDYEAEDVACMARVRLMRFATENAYMARVRRMRFATESVGAGQHEVLALERERGRCTGQRRCGGTNSGVGT